MSVVTDFARSDPYLPAVGEHASLEVAPEAMSDGPGFRALMAAHAGYVRRLLRSLGVSEADLPDLCQDTFLVVHRQLPGFEGRSTLRTWIAGIARRLASDYRERAYRKSERNADELPDIPVEAGQQRWLESRENWILMDSVLGDLREEQRTVFVLYELENVPMLEIAMRVDCPVSTAYARLHAARKAVRENRAQG